VTILAFTNVWGEVLLQSVLLNRDSAATLSVRLSAGILDPTGNAILIGPTLAAILLYVLPPCSCSSSSSATSCAVSRRPA
jgi:ABC-type glycerol-3-phosphate transport system permease component